MSERSGLSPEELARRSAAEMVAADRASAMLGMTLTSAGPGGGVVTMTVRDDMVNGYGACHGGIIASLADTAFAVACNSYGVVTVAAGFDVAFLEPAHAGDELVATAREVARRGRSGLYDVQVVRTGDGVVVAEFRGRSRSLGRPLPGLAQD